MQPIVLMDKDNIIDGIEQNTYHFKHARGSCHWPKQQGRGLGRCGMWNFLWRIGFHPTQCYAETLPTATNNRLLFIDKSQAMDKDTYTALQKWMHEGGKIIATGELNSWQAFLPSEYQWHTSTFDNPYAASAYLFDDYDPQLLTPPNWKFISYDGPIINDKRFIGHITAVQGERQTPARALLTRHTNAPALIIHNSFYYFNGLPFAAFQSWLQGQEDLSPWLSWRHRLFWLDEWISFFCDLMIKLEIFNKTTHRPGIKNLSQTTVILRHDLDYSRDTTFLSEENKNNIVSTHAILKDRNTNFWVNQLKPFQNHEMAFHYDTSQRNWLGLIQRFIMKKNRASFKQSSRKITKNGLLKQIQWAKKQGIDVKTIHRHLCFLIYPELIDALDTVFESDLNVLGSSSLFRAHVLRWGIDRIEGNHGFLADWPDSQFPLWYPFKLGHAGKNGKLLQGWEMTSLMEIEPDMLNQILDHKIKHINQNIFVLNFHPAHANQPTLYKQGSLDYFKSVLKNIVERNIETLSMANVLQRINSNFGTN